MRAVDPSIEGAVRVVPWTEASLREAWTVFVACLRRRRDRAAVDGRIGVRHPQRRRPEEPDLRLRLERAIGVIYRPETERRSHYFHARLADQFDVVLHIDETRAVEPLERTAAWTRAEPADTFPSGL